MTPYTRTKICGITSVADAEAVADAGADAIGLVFYEPSPRNVDLKTAAEIIRCVGPFVSVVALFVDPSPEFVRSVIDKVELAVLQFHGKESPAFCEQFSRCYVKALRVAQVPTSEVSTRAAIEAQAASYSKAAGILLDTLSQKAVGGTGERFDWRSAPQTNRQDTLGESGVGKHKHWILAGGLTPDNVAEAIATVKPYGVDVSSGVELAPGKKDPRKVAEFIQRVRNAN